MEAVISPDVGAGIFETLLVLGGRPLALGPHLDRLASSARAVYGAVLDVSVGSAVEASVRTMVTDLAGPHRLRIFATPAGSGPVTVELDCEPAPSAFDGRPASSARLVPTVIEGGLGPHKWRDRAIIERRRAVLGLDSSSHLLIVDADGAVLETERGNVVALLDGVLTSPPPDGRLLAGVSVAHAFAVAERLGVPVVFGSLTLPDLERAAEVFCTSSVRGLTPAALAGCLTAGAGAHRAPSGDASGRRSTAERLGPAMLESWRSA